MTSKLKKELIAKQKEVTEKLIAQGIDYHQARFMVLSAGAEPDGLLEDQPTEGKEMDPELVYLANQVRKENKIKLEKDQIRKRYKG